jgi:Sec-independent protein translocase protein TatA
MFDISLSEIMVVLLGGFLFLGPRELVRVMRTIRSYIWELKNQIFRIEREISDEIDSDDFIKTIKDADGIHQKVYDLEKIKPYIRNDD